MYELKEVTHDVKLLLDAIAPPEVQHRTALDPVELGRLADSIGEVGLLQPLGVVQHADPDAFTLVWGWRRYNALRLRREVTARCTVFPRGYDADRARAAENEFRQDLNPIERARICARWLHEGIVLPEIARRWRKSLDTIEAWLALLRLPPELQDAVATGAIAAAVARELAQVDHEGYRADLLREAQRVGINTRGVVSWVAAYHADRERIIANHETVQDIVRNAHKYVVKLACEVCAGEVPLSEARDVRVCVGCYRELVEAIQQAKHPA